MKQLIGQQFILSEAIEASCGSRLYSTLLLVNETTALRIEADVLDGMGYLSVSEESLVEPPPAPSEVLTDVYGGNFTVQ